MILYIRRSTILTEMDAITKFLTLICLGVIVFTQPYWIGAILFVILFLAAIFAGKLEPSEMRLGLSMALFLGFFMILGGFWTAGGKTVLFELGPLRYTLEGLIKRGTNAIRIIDIMFSSFLFIWTTNPRDFVVGLTYIGLPYRIAFTIFVGLNYIPVMVNEFAMIKEAQTLRGIVDDRSPGGLMRRYLASLVTIMIRALRKAQITAFALDSKGFGASLSRTYLKEFHWSLSGIITLGFMVIVTFMGFYAVFVLHLWQAYIWAY
jgi:energy-coupling factor transport system permease protein